MHCLKCKYVSITFQHFMDLLLDIRNADNIESAMSGYFKKEVLGQEDAYKGILIKIGEYNVLDLDPPPPPWGRGFQSFRETCIKKGGGGGIKMKLR